MQHLLMMLATTEFAKIRCSGFQGLESAFPQAFCIVFLGNGMNEDHWSAEGQGLGMKLSRTLSPFEPLKQKINVMDGLYVHALTGQGIHPAQTGSLLSGAHNKNSDSRS